MEKTIKLSALLVANQLDIKGIKTFLEVKAASESSTELFFSFGNGRYQYYFNYGVIVFAGHSEEEIKIAIKAILPYLKDPNNNWMRDELQVSSQEGQMEFDFNELIVDRLDNKVSRIAMFNLAQSVALDYYHNVTENLLTEIKGFARDLEKTGKLSINRKDMIKFIGKALTTQNDIADNIYIFDAPEHVWDDEYLTHHLP